ncbi:hypothetical protein GQ568_02670 [Patescibacteria group bacterium]|nr:hypothetical protein [Patescibacteria group bacterium]
METKIKNKNKNKNINKISFIIALFFVLAQAGQANVVSGASISAGEIIRLTNESRAEAELPLLLVNEELTEAAMEKADDMFEFQYFDHNSPSGSTPWDFIRSAGYDYAFAGENLAIDFVTANGAHRALMESASHRDNILNSNYTEIGIAVIEGIFEGNKSIIIVEEFGAPLKKEVVVDYDLNENIELIFEEKVNEINNLKDDDKNEKELEEFSQTGSTQEYGADIKREYGANAGQENEVKGLEEESASEQDDGLLLGDLSNGFDIWNPAFRLFENGQDKILYHNYETLKGEFHNTKHNLDEEKISSVITEHKPILLTGDLNNEKVMGLVNKAYAKDELIKKYDYQQNSAGLAVNRYFQKEFIGRVLLLYGILSITLVSNFVSLVYFYNTMRN